MIDPLPGVATMFVGASGGVVAVTGVESGEHPTDAQARIVYVYVVPGCSPEFVNDVDVAAR